MDQSPTPQPDNRPQNHTEASRLPPMQVRIPPPPMQIIAKGWLPRPDQEATATELEKVDHGRR